MSIWKAVLVLVLGLGCGVAFVAVSGVVFKKSVSFRYDDVQVTVVDKATGKPIPNAQVSASYSGDHYFGRPEPNSAVTDSKGVATVKIARGTNDCLFVMLKAKGYYDGKTGWSTEYGAPISCQLDQLPKIALTVPNGCAGPIKFNMPERPDNRQFDLSPHEYHLHADAAGNVAIEDVETLGDYYALEEAFATTFLTASYEDGSQIPLADGSGVTDSTPALRYVGAYFAPKNPPDAKPRKVRDVLETLDTSKLQEIYVIGTDEDRQATHDSMPDMDRIGVSFDFDVHDYNWGKTSAGFESK
jgi:hypothetical protein